MKKYFLSNVINVTLGTGNEFQKRLMGGDKSHPEDDDYNGGSSYDGW